MSKEFAFTVRGKWPFPLEMLQHDGAKAATPEDQVKIDKFSGEHAPDRDVFRDVEINLVGPRKPSTARWDSFIWSVPTDTEYKSFREAGKRSRERKILRDRVITKLSSDELDALGQCA